MAKIKTMAELQRRVAAERVRAGNSRVRFSAELRRDIVAMIGATSRRVDRVAEQLGLSSSTVYTWLSKGRRGSRAGKAGGASPKRKLRPVKIVDGAPEALQSHMLLRFPSGAELAVRMSDLKHLLGLKQ